MSPLTPEEYRLYQELLETHCGISLSDDQQYLVQNRLSDLGVLWDVQTFKDLYDFFLDHREALLPLLIERMTTNETLWFRDQSCWQVLENHIFPELFKKLDEGAPKISIWSVACSTGQEPYSLAILIDEMSRRLNKEHHLEKIVIHAVDISERALNTANSGVYTEFAVNRGLSEARKAKYFHQLEDNLWQINEEIQKRVHFEKKNLLKPFGNQGPHHLILCRNVAIYFNETVHRELFEKLVKTMHPQGYLLVGASESLRKYSDFLEIHHLEGGAYYQPQS